MIKENEESSKRAELWRIKYWDETAAHAKTRARLIVAKDKIKKLCIKEYCLDEIFDVFEDMKLRLNDE